MKTKEILFEDDLISKIVEGIWQTGEKLPSERQMATEFNISRNTVRSALRRLEAKGMITPRRGSGYFLTNTISATAIRQQREGESYDRIMARLEAAYLFLPNIISIATPRIAEETLNTLQQCMVDLSQAIFNKNIQEFKNHARDFFQIIANSTGNPIIKEIVSFFCASSSLMFPGFFSFSDKEQEKLFADYVLIYNAMKKRDTEEAVTCTRNKIVNTSVAFSKLKGLQLPFSIAQELENMNER